MGSYGARAEQTQRDCFRHRTIARFVGMKVIAAVIGRQQPIRMRRVADRRVEVDDRVEHGRPADHRVDRLPGGFGLCRGVVIIVADERGYCRADQPDAM